jgi:NADPH-dependent 2,4-dienoyl-CoA reductase/sulfur reductase-like enzyme
MLTKDVDLAIIGAGPAGMAAALSAHEAGVENILMLERAENPGGLLHQCIHTGFGLHYFKEDLTGPEYAERFINKLNSSDVTLCLNTMVMHLHPDGSIIAMNGEWGEFKVRPRSVVLAMGCREKTRFGIGIPGSRPAGIFTAGLAQKLVNVDGYLPGREFVILGSGDIGMIMARRLHLEGATVKAVIEIMPHVGGLIRNEVQCLHDFGIPLLLRHTVTEIYGDERLQGVRIAPVDDSGNPLKEQERSIGCDTLLLSVGLIPENELSKEAGVQIDGSTGGPLVDEFSQTNVDGIFAAGNVVQVYDLVDNVTLGGEVAGKNAAQYAAGGIKKGAKEIRVIAGEGIKSVTPQRISGSGNVDLTVRVRNPLENVELTVGEYRKKYKVVSPTEVMKVRLKPSDLAGSRKSNNVTVACHTLKGKG